MRLWILVLYMFIEFSCIGQYKPEELIPQLENSSIDFLVQFETPKNLKTKEIKELNLILKSILYAKKNNLRVRLDCLLMLADEQNPTTNFAKTYANYHLGCLLTLYNLNDIAKKHNFLAVSYSKKNKYLPLLFYAYRNIGGIYFSENQLDKAKQYFEMSNQCNSKHLTAETASNINNIGLCEFKLKNYDKAISAYRRGLQLISKNKHPLSEVVKNLITGNLGAVYAKKNQPVLAQKYLISELNYYRKKNQIGSDKLGCLLQLKLLNESDPNKANLYSQEIINDLRNLPNQNEKFNFISAYLKISKTNLTPKDKFELIQMQSLSGQQTLLERNRTQHLILSALYNSRVQSLSKNLSLEIKQKHIQEQANKYKNLLLLGVLLITITLVYFLKKQHKIKLTTIQQQSIIQEQKTKLIETNQRLLEKKVSQQNSELQRLMTNLKIKHEIENGFLLKIKELKKNKTANIDTVITELQLNLNNLKEIDRKLVKNSFKDHSINNDFTMRLAAAHPSLSQEEIEFCHYFISKLSAKEIGQITNHSDGTIRVIKHKIKQKLGLNKEESMVNYLENVSSK